MYVIVLMMYWKFSGSLGGSPGGMLASSTWWHAGLQYLVACWPPVPGGMLASSTWWHAGLQYLMSLYPTPSAPLLFCCDVQGFQ